MATNCNTGFLRGNDADLIHGYAYPACVSVSFAQWNLIQFCESFTLDSMTCFAKMFDSTRSDFVTAEVFTPSAPATFGAVVAVVCHPIQFFTLIHEISPWQFWLYTLQTATPLITGCSKSATRPDRKYIRRTRDTLAVEV